MSETITSSCQNCHGKGKVYCGADFDEVVERCPACAGLGHVADEADVVALRARLAEAEARVDALVKGLVEACDRLSGAPWHDGTIDDRGNIARLRALAGPTRCTSQHKGRRCVLSNVHLGEHLGGSVGWYDCGIAGDFETWGCTCPPDGPPCEHGRRGAAVGKT